MNRDAAEAPKNGIELEYDLDEPPQKVWRAISIAAFRENWLPNEACLLYTSPSPRDS